MPHVIESAASGRSKCRGCGRKIDKGALRFGERVENPFGDGEATLWFHLVCGACRRPETFDEALRETTVEIGERAFVEAAAKAGLDHHRLQRLSGVQKDPSGRARCRQCRERIEKGAWRVVLQIWEDTRFSPMGFVHVSCAPEYFGTPDLAPRIRAVTTGLEPTEIDEALTALPNVNVDVDADERGSGPSE